MKILLSASDRDLLSGYERLLAAEGHEAVAAFDGVMALSCAGGGFDVAVIDDSLSRLPSSDVLKAFVDLGTPNVMLVSSRLKSENYLSPVLPDTFLCYPFLPDELKSAIGAAAGMKDSPGFSFAGVAVSPAKRSFGDQRVTREETELMRKLSENVPVTGTEYDVLIRAVNAKLEKAGSKARISYITNEGYKVVDTVE